MSAFLGLKYHFLVKTTFLLFLLNLTCGLTYRTSGHRSVAPIKVVLRNEISLMLHLISYHVESLLLSFYHFPLGFTPRPIILQIFKFISLMEGPQNFDSSCRGGTEGFIFRSTYPQVFGTDKRCHLSHFHYYF